MSDLSGESLRYKFLGDEEAERLYTELPELRRAPDDYCPTCFKEEGIDCDCELQTQLYKHYMSSGIGSLYYRLTWSDYIGNEEYISTLKEFYDSLLLRKGIGIYVTGSYGVGKTLGLSLLLKDLVKRGEKVFATTYSSLVEMMGSGWRSQEDQAYFNSKIRRVPILMIDDIGKEFENRLSQMAFDDLVRTRVQYSRPTFITSNISLEELKNKYGASAHSLLSEVCIPIVIKEEKDQRKSTLYQKISQGIQPIV